MKYIRLVNILFIVLVVSSCADEEVKKGSIIESELFARYLDLKPSSVYWGGPEGSSYQRGYFTSTSTDQEATCVNSMANNSFVPQEGGVIFSDVTVDYGDGCRDDLGRIFIGKKRVIVIDYPDLMTETSSVHEKIYIFDGYGNTDWHLSGKVRFHDIITSYNFGTPSDSTLWRTSYNFTVELNEILFANSAIVDEIKYEIAGVETFTKNQLTIHQASTVINSTSGFKLTTNIIEPLTFNFQCSENRLVAHSGIESGQILMDDEEKPFLLNYGTNECDNMVLLDLDGISRTLNVSEIQYWK